MVATSALRFYFQRDEIGDFQNPWAGANFERTKILQQLTDEDTLRSVLVSMALTVLCMAQVPHTPDVESQRSTMKKLEFFVGEWSGEERVYPFIGY